MTNVLSVATDDHNLRGWVLLCAVLVVRCAHVCNQLGKVRRRTLYQSIKIQGDGEALQLPFSNIFARYKPMVSFIVLQFRVIWGSYGGSSRPPWIHIPLEVISEKIIKQGLFRKCWTVLIQT
jgi:hypothetical protein